MFFILNFDFLVRKRFFEGGGGLFVIVGVNNVGLLLFKDIFCVILLVFIFWSCRILVISIVM